MELFYCDESGVPYSVDKLPELVDQKHVDLDPWYFLGMLALSEEQRYRTYNLISNVKNRYVTKLAPFGLLHERSPESELKGSLILSIAEGQSVTPHFPLWKNLGQSEAKRLIEELIEGLVRVGLLGSFYVVAIEQRLLYRKYYRIARSAAFVALTFLQQRACVRADSKTTLGALIIDRGSAVENQWNILEFLAARDEISREARVNYDYDRLLLENPLGAISSDFAQIQVCDVFTHIVSRAVRNRDPKWHWFQKLLPLIGCSDSGQILGVGLLFYPFPEALPAGFETI